MRALYRLCSLGVLTGVLTVIWVGRIPFLTQTGQQQWRGRMVGLWARNVLRVLGTKVQTEGMPPNPPFCMVSNHLSYLDIVVYQSLMPCLFVAKSEVAYWPIIGWLAKAIGTLFINRGSKRDVVRINSHIEEALHRGEGVILFPEGTSGKGDHVLPFKTAILGTVADIEYPVSYAAITYRSPSGQPPANMALCWWGDMTFVDHFFNMLKLPSFEVTIVFGQEVLQSSDRKEMARLLNEKVSDNFVPVV